MSLPRPRVLACVHDVTRGGEIVTLAITAAEVRPAAMLVRIVDIRTETDWEGRLRPEEDLEVRAKLLHELRLQLDNEETERAARGRSGELLARIVAFLLGRSAAFFPVNQEGILAALGPPLNERELERALRWLREDNLVLPRDPQQPTWVWLAPQLPGIARGPVLVAEEPPATWRREGSPAPEEQN